MKTQETVNVRKPKYKKSTNFRFCSKDDPKVAAVEHIWPGSIELLAHRSKLYERVLALAELPSREELPRILQVSQRENIPSLWRRARPSRLETNATALICALVFSSSDHWVALVREFLKVQDFIEQLRGRPKMKPKQTLDYLRGVQIDELIAGLEPGFQIKLEANRRGGFTSDDEEIDAALKLKGYDDNQRAALRRAATLQDAAFRYYLRVEGTRRNITLKAVQNSYARYKHIVERLSVRNKDSQ